MSVVPLPDMKLYWSENPSFHNERIAESGMSRNDYRTILSYFKLSDNKQNDGSKLWKLGSFPNYIQKKFQEYWIPGLCQTVDEAMISCKNRSKFLQYMPSKPQKWGFKMWKMVDSIKSYVYSFEIYTGGSSSDNSIPDISVGGNVVIRLAKTLPRVVRASKSTLYVFFADNFFTSINLVKYLKEQSIRFIGTVRTSSSGFPRSKLCNNLKSLSDKKGSFKCVTLTKEILALVWSSTKNVFFLASVPMGDVIKKIIVKGKETVCPLVAFLYRKYMGGVDINDQHLSYYRTGRKTRKWWHRIFWYIIDMAIVNAWLIESEMREKDNLKRRTQLQFRLELAEELIDKHGKKVRENKTHRTIKLRGSSSKKEVQNQQRTVITRSQSSTSSRLFQTPISSKSELSSLKSHKQTSWSESSKISQSSNKKHKKQTSSPDLSFSSKSLMSPDSTTYPKIQNPRKRKFSEMSCQKSSNEGETTIQNSHLILARTYQSKCAYHNCNRNPKYSCETCKVFLCPGCFKSYHDMK